MTGAPPSRWRRWWLDARALAIPLGAYWGALAIGMGLFLAVAVLVTNTGPQDLYLFVSLAGGCALSIAVGQFLAVLRLRTWVIVTLGCVGWAGVLVVTGAALETVGEDLAAPLFVLLLLGPFWALAGVWSLRTQGALLAAWAPVMWLVVSILVISEKRGTSIRWFEGNKWAIWDVLTAPVLLLGVTLMLVYLVSRELHRLHRWRFGPGGPDLPRVERLESAKRAKVGIGCGGVMALAMLALALTVATALVAPFLWRSAPDDDTDDTTQVDQPQQQPQPQQPQQPDQGCNQDQQEDGQGDGEGQGQAQEQTPQERMQEALRQGAGAVVNLLLLLVLALAILVVFGPPLRRQLLLTHLRRSFWPIPPTREIEQSWRLVEVVLADHGVHRRSRETRIALAERAKQELEDMDHLPLERCAEVADRVTYGLGLRPDDTMMARRAAEMAFQTLWDRLSELEKIKANYRWL